MSSPAFFCQHFLVLRSPSCPIYLIPHFPALHFPRHAFGPPGQVTHAAVVVVVVNVYSLHEGRSVVSR